MKRYVVRRIFLQKTLKRNVAHANAWVGLILICGHFSLAWFN